MDWLSIWRQVGAGLAALNLDLSAPTLAKYIILLIAVVALLWVIGDVYRGEIQNRDMEIAISRNTRLPAKVIIEHRFLIVHGDREFSRRVRVFRRSFRLHAQPIQTATLRHGEFAFSEEVEKEIKNRAEYLVREGVRRYRNKPSNWLARLLNGSRWIEPTPVPTRYIARIHFPSNPLFLLFQHPDREVKATGWLTLLTSIFALLGQFLFSESADKAQEVRPAEQAQPE